MYQTQAKKRVFPTPTFSEETGNAALYIIDTQHKRFILYYIWKYTVFQRY